MESSLSVYLKHRDELLSYAVRLLHDRASAEDVVQEAWLRFSAHVAEGAVEQPRSYLYTIVRNLAFDWRRRAANSRLARLPDRPMEAIPSDAPAADSVVYFRGRLRTLQQALSELPALTQRAFHLHRVERRTLEETASLLGISTVAVHKRVKRATLHCAERLHGAEDEE